jgi:hypothetical protein
VYQVSDGGIEGNIFVPAKSRQKSSEVAPFLRCKLNKLNNGLVFRDNLVYLTLGLF